MGDRDFSDAGTGPCIWGGQRQYGLCESLRSCGATYIQSPAMAGTVYFRWTEPGHSGVNTVFTGNIGKADAEYNQRVQ